MDLFSTKKDIVDILKYLREIKAIKGHYNEHVLSQMIVTDIYIASFYLQTKYEYLFEIFLLFTNISLEEAKFLMLKNC